MQRSAGGRDPAEPDGRGQHDLVPGQRRAGDRGPDGTLSGGVPGILASGAADAGAWSGGSAGFQVSYASTDSSGVKSYSVISANNGDGPQTLRVLTPTNPAAGVAHNFLIVLPVEAGLGTTFGDGLGTLESLDAQDKYNLTIIEPTFATRPGTRTTRTTRACSTRRS